MDGVSLGLEFSESRFLEKLAVRFECFACVVAAGRNPELNSLPARPPRERQLKGLNGRRAEQTTNLKMRPAAADEKETPPRCRRTETHGGEGGSAR